MQIFNTSDFRMGLCFSHAALISEGVLAVSEGCSCKPSYTSNGEKNAGCDFLHFPEALFVKDGNFA